MSGYDAHGQEYGRVRRADPRLADRLHAALWAARSVLNVGAGTGSYEPGDRTTIAVDPSVVMLSQRDRGAAPAVQGQAEALPFRDRTFDAVLGVLTLHHWRDRRAGLAECARVARERVVLFTWDPASEGFWLVKEYLPEFLAFDRAQFPSINSLGAAFEPVAKVTVIPFPIPHDCTDGFLGAYWRRPEAYLDPAVRAGISSFGRVPSAVGRIEALRADLSTGAWQSRHRALLAQEELDIGYRLVIADLE
jgi:SAM-dependent methyltransferase